MSGKGQRLGYARVSNHGQNAERRLERLDADRAFTDHASGKDARRPEPQALLTRACDGVSRREAGG